MWGECVNEQERERERASAVGGVISKRGKNMLGEKKLERVDEQKM